MVHLCHILCDSLHLFLLKRISRGFKYSRVSPTIEKYEAALLMLLGFGGFSVTVAVVYNGIRRYVFKDSHNLDTVFDAGGRVSLSLTAVTVTSQLLWPADFLQSSTLIRKVMNTCIYDQFKTMHSAFYMQA